MLLSKEELHQAGQYDPQFAQWSAANPSPPNDHTSHLPGRAVMTYMSKAILERLGSPPAGISETYHTITLRDGSDSKLKITKPTSGTPGPLAVLIFGGGFVGGDVDQLSEVARLMAQNFGATAVCITYRLAPEFKFPHPQTDAIDSVRWIAQNATGSLLSSDPTKGFVVGGVSAGAAISACISRFFQAEDEKLPYPLTGQWLCVPSLMDAERCPEKFRDRYIAREQNAFAPGLSKASMDLGARLLEPDYTSPLRSPINSKNAIAGQPRTYTQVDGLDPLRDDGLIYDEMLKEAGVETKIDHYPGCPHAHHFIMRGYEIGDRGLVDMMVGLGWLLRKEITRDEAAKALGLGK